MKRFLGILWIGIRMWGEEDRGMRLSEEKENCSLLFLFYSCIVCDWGGEVSL